MQKTLLKTAVLAAAITLSGVPAFAADDATPIHDILGEGGAHLKIEITHAPSADGEGVLEIYTSKTSYKAGAPDYILPVRFNNHRAEVFLDDIAPNRMAYIVKAQDAETGDMLTVRQGSALLDYDAQNWDEASFYVPRGISYRESRLPDPAPLELAEGETSKDSQAEGGSFAALNFIPRLLSFN